MSKLLQSIVVQPSTKASLGICETPANEQLRIYKAQLSNGHSGAVNVALLRSLLNRDWKLFTLSTPVSDLVTVDVTSSIQAGTTTKLFVANDATSGYLFQSTKKFSLIGLTIDGAETGSPVYTIKYFNGSTYETLPVIDVVSSYTAATHTILFASPLDWEIGSTVAIGGDADKYSVLVESSTASTADVTANVAWLGDMIEYYPNVASKGIVTYESHPQYPITLDGGEDLIPYFGNANTVNIASVQYIIED